MKYIILLCLALAMLSCNNNRTEHTVSDTLAVGSAPKNTSDQKVNGASVVTSLCFLRTEGINSRDTTSVELVVKGDKVSGIMNWLPYQKDSRKGTLIGVIKNDTITANWAFMQEGMKDTLNLKFLLKNDSLSQKPLKLDAKTGRQQTDEGAGYSISFTSSAQLHK